jgi:exonuclease SbcD
VVAIAGNHDMPERIEAPDPLARECGIVFAGFPDSEVNPFGLENGFRVAKSAPGFIEIAWPGKTPLRIILTPYANEIRMRKGLSSVDQEEELRQLLKDHWNRLAETYCDEQGVNVLLAHLLFMNEGSAEPEEPEDERPINHIGGAQAIFTSCLPREMQYVALGHLHRMQRVSEDPCPVIYSGSPLSYSFSEAGQRKQLIIVDLEPGKKADIRTVELKSGKKLARMRFDQLDKAVEWLQQNQDVLVELTLVTDTFLSGAERRQLTDIHEGIVTIIPEIRQTDESANARPGEAIAAQSDLGQLFEEYFKSKKGQLPDEELCSLFREVLSETEDKEN